jgi:hypothetical protein
MRRQQHILGWPDGQASAYTFSLYGYTLTGARPDSTRRTRRTQVSWKQPSAAFLGIYS